MDTIIELRNVTKSFSRRKSILHHINLSIERKQSLAIMGHNGSGKSTLLKLIAGLTQPSNGKIIRQPDTVIGYAPEHFPRVRFSAEEYLYAMGMIHNIPKSTLENRIGELLDLFMLKDKGRIQYFSKGMLQKVNLMQAVLGKPSVLILDEPLSGLDAASQVELARLLTVFKHEGMTIIITCHESQLMNQIAERVLVLNNGRIESDRSYSTPEQEVRYRIVYSLPDEIEEDADIVKGWLPRESILYFRNGNELCVKEEHRDAILLELLQRKCSIESVTQVRGR